jgi:hypothetical protein
MNNEEFQKIVEEEIKKTNGGFNTHGQDHSGGSLFPGNQSNHKETIVMPISFHGTLDHFSKNKGAEWTPDSSHPKIVHAGIPNDLAGDFVKDSTGVMKRRVLTSATIGHVKNTSPVPIGIKFENLPSTSVLVTTKGSKDVDFIIPPETNLTRVDHNIYESNHRPEYINNLLTTGWGGITKKTINNSISEKLGHKESVAWKITPNSPIVEYMHFKNRLNDKNFAVVSKDGHNPDHYLIQGDVASTAKNDLLKELELTPFHNPSEIKATIYRMDSPSWTDTKIGGSFNHASLMPNQQTENIVAHLHLNYDLYPVQ